MYIKEFPIFINDPISMNLTQDNICNAQCCNFTFEERFHPDIKNRVIVDSMENWDRLTEQYFDVNVFFCINLIISFILGYTCRLLCINKDELKKQVNRHPAIVMLLLCLRPEIK